MLETVKNQARGHWLSIYQSLGINVRDDGKHDGCPMCGPGRNKHRFRVSDRNGSGDWVCSQCGTGDGIDLVQKVLNVDFKEAIKLVSGVMGVVEKQPRKINDALLYNPERLRKMYRNSRPLDGFCIGSNYLEKRGLKTFPPTLRTLNKCWEPETREEMPALLATFNAPDSEALTLHRTFLTESCEKARIGSPRKIMTPKKKMIGGAVRLFDSDITLGVAEGVETAIACHEIADLPVWATLSASLLEGFVPPTEAKTIVIFGDNDKTFAGQKSAYTLANKLALKGKSVVVYIPERPGDDWLDVHNRGGGL